MKGGYRKGAGRKQGFAAKNAEEARRLLSDMVMREIIPIGEALVIKAKNGEVAAIRELFDRAWGKSRQSHEVTTKEDPSPIDNVRHVRLTQLIEETNQEITKAAPNLNPDMQLALLAKKVEEKMRYEKYNLMS